MLKYPCLVLDHDDTVVQTLKTLSYPFWCLELEQFRPGAAMSLRDYVLECYRWGFADMCRKIYQFTDEELALEHKQWTEYIHQNTPEPFPGMERIIHRQTEAGGRIFVVSHSSSDTILRDYAVHFGIQPDEVYGWDRPAHERKPNPFPLQDIMEKYGYQPEEILVVDDMQLACQMADPLGVKVCFAGWDDMGVPQQRADMEARCAFTCNSVEEFEKFLFD